MHDKWVMVIGAGFWQIPLIKTVQRLGFKALAIDMNPRSDGAAVADRFEPVNIVDADSAIALGREVGIAGAVSDQTDLSVPTLARICEALNLPGPSIQTAFNTTNKARMRELAGQAGLKNPRYRVVRTIPEAVKALTEDHPTAPGGVGFPCVVKPTDSQASRGVQRVDEIGYFEGACVEAFRFSREEKILIEEFIEGTEVTVEGCRYAGETHLLGVSAKKHTPPPHIIAVNLDFPAQMPPEVIAEIKYTYETLVKALGIEAGSIHGELIVSNDGIYLVEMANRGGGSGTSSHVIPAISGVDLLEANVNFATGGEKPVRRTIDRAGVLRFLLFPPGLVESISGVEESRKIQGVVTCGLYINPGDNLSPPVMDTQRHGYIITAADSLDTARKIADNVEHTIKVSYRLL